MEKIIPESALFNEEESKMIYDIMQTLVQNQSKLADMKLQHIREEIKKDEKFKSIAGLIILMGDDVEKTLDEWALTKRDEMQKDLQLKAKLAVEIMTKVKTLTK